MSLQKYSVTGHLLKVTSGHLAKECCCGAGSGICACDPALDFTYTVTLSGFATASDTRYAGIDGAWDIEWTDGCFWKGCFQDPSTPTRYFSLTMYIDVEICPRNWVVDFYLTNASCIPSGGQLGWKRPIATAPDCGDPCSVRPPGADYAWYNGFQLAGNADESGVVSCSVA
jgi:hypothetical protein